MVDEVTEVSTESWLSRIGGSLLGIFFGLVLFITAPILLWWNEGQSIETYRSLSEGQKEVLAISIDSLQQGANGRLVYAKGQTVSNDTLIDSDFSVAMTAVKMMRRVKMYQWVEREQSQSTSNLGGSKTTTKTYSYELEWSETENDSSGYKEAQGHSNPAMPYRTQEFFSKNVRLGAFVLNSSQIDRMKDYQVLTVPTINVPSILGKRKVSKVGQEYYIGDNPIMPRLGDLKLSYEVVMPGMVSIVAQQSGNQFMPFITKAGGSVDLFATGVVASEQMFLEAQKENAGFTWMFRGVGFLLFWLAAYMMFSPLVVIADLIPLFGGLLATGAGIISLIIAGSFSLITIAASWIAHRPLLGLLLLILAGFTFCVLFIFANKRGR